MLFVIFYTIVIAWFAFRIFYQKQFMVWDWHDGKFEYQWTNDKYTRNPRSF